MERTTSYCRICAAGCGIIVTTDGVQVVGVEGDVDHPTSHGYLCAKGRGLAEWHHRPDRLDVPRLRGRTATWDETLDDLASALREVRAAASPDAIALYLATGLAYDAAGQMIAPTWLKSIGSRSVLSAATVDNAPALVAAEMVTGNAMVNPAWDPHAGGLLLIVGSNPVVSHGYGTALPDPITYLRQHRANGGRLWVVDPRATETAHQADEHLQVVPGTDVALLATLAAALLADVSEIPGCTADDLATLRALLDGWTIERAAAVTGVDVELVDALVRDVLDHRGRTAVMCGTGAQMSRDGLLIEWLRWIVLILSGSLEQPGGMRFIHGIFGPPVAPATHETRSKPGPASRPELPRVIDQIPVVALVDEIESGNIRALIVTGGNLLTAAPDPQRMARALQSLDVLAVLDVVDGPMSELATHVLPATGQLERADFQLSINYAMRPAVQSTPA
ncbi:MAG: molybdopterin-dependent oxidoreductase, partial [Acidimicrobiia bacterium]